MNITIRGSRRIDILFMDTGIFMLVILTCFPVTLCLPGIVRQGMQAASMMLFAVGLFLQNKKNQFWSFILIVAISIIRVYGIWRFKKEITTCVFNVFAGWAFVFFAISCFIKKDSHRVGRLFQLVVILCAVTALTTIIGLEKYPLSVRELGRSDTGYYGVSGEAFSALKRTYRLNNIAGWNQLYGMVFMLPALLISMIKRKHKLLYLIAFILLCTCIARAQLTIAVLMAAVLIILTMISPSRNRIKLAVLFIVGMIGVACILYYDDLIRIAADQFAKIGMNMISRKLLDLFYLLNGEVKGDAMSRIRLYSVSIDSFLKHPLFGQILQGGGTIEKYSYHSDFFDMAAFYGLPGILFDLILLSLYGRVVRNYNKEVRWNAFLLMAVCFGMYVLNPVWYSPQIFIGTFWTPVFLMDMTPGYKRGHDPVLLTDS